MLDQCNVCVLFADFKDILLPMPGFNMISKVLLASCLVATFITFKSKVLVLIFNMLFQKFW